MNITKTYIIWMDILGFHKLAKEVAKKHELSDGKVRKDLLDEVDHKIEVLEKEKIISYGDIKELDAWILFIKGLDNLFRFIQEITNIKPPYKDLEQVLLEIAIGSFKSSEDVNEYEKYGEETMQFLKTDIISEYRRDYKRNHESSPKETYILITEDVFNDLGREDKKSCECVIGKNTFYRFNKAKEKGENIQLLDIDKLLNKHYLEDLDFLIRDRTFLEDKEEKHPYTLIRKNIHQRIESNKDFLIQINQQSFLKQLRKVQIEPKCEVDFDDDINICTFKHNENELELNEPLLLWECSCKVPEAYRNRNYQCRIHSNPKGKIIGEAFGRKFTKIKYGNVGVLWFDTESDILWPPAIDSVFMAKILKEKGYGEKIIENVLDMGCGTGFLGIFLTMINSHVKKVYFSDLFLTPLLITKLNWALNFKENSTKDSIAFLSENYENFSGQAIPTSGFDLVVCNPPFLPTLGYEWLLYNKAAVAGTHLLEKIITETKKYGDELVIGGSSMAHPEFEKAVKKAGAKVEILGQRETPFRISYAFNHKEFMDKLISEERIERKDQSPFKFWFTFYVYKIKYEKEHV